MSQLVKPHGSDTLKPLLLEGDALSQAKAAAASLPQVRLSSRERGDLIMFGIGGFTPLDGFMAQADWQGVMKGTEKSRTIAKVNLSHKAFDDRLTLSGSISQTFEQNDYENYDGWDKDDIIYQALTRNPTDPVYEEDGVTPYQTLRVFNYENPISVIDD
mgnify:CR=1 FL=1